MKLVVGWGLGGASFTTRDRSPSTARIGEPTWGPAGLMRDLELRLGLPLAEESTSVRVPRWISRIQNIDKKSAFYAASFRADPIGTAETLLAWRDDLVEAGWDGGTVAGGGERLDALAAIEKYHAQAAPSGNADRLVRIERALGAAHAPIYDLIELVEERSLWSRRWQSIFDRLEKLGTRFDLVRTQLEGAPASTDLGLLQDLLRRNVTLKGAGNVGRLRGDGSVLVFRGETPVELGDLTAAFLAENCKADGALVVRAMDSEPLEWGLARHGLASQGHDSASLWRPAAQVLPLALELAFEPRDPHRILELLTLPVGPFRGRLGAMLARAIGRQPGMGGQEWIRQKNEASRLMLEDHLRLQRDLGKTEGEAKSLAEAHVNERMQRLADWIETPGAGIDGATRSRLLEITARVRQWLQVRAAPDSENRDAFTAAYGQAKAFTEALTHHDAERLTREDTQRLFDRVVRFSYAHGLFFGEAGHFPWVTHPSAVLASVPTVIFWSFVAGTERRFPSLPWNLGERRALAEAGVVFVEPARLLASEANAWRRGILAARERVIFVMPRSVQGTPTPPQSLWDEIAARLGIDEDPRATSLLVREVGALLRAEQQSLVRVATLPVLPLPNAPAGWQVPPAALEDVQERGTSATALQRLAECPLAWVFEHRARLWSGAVAKIIDGPRLNGNLGHRLVEELFSAKAFELGEPAFLEQVDTTFEKLIQTEGATLLLPGAAFERSQLSHQLRQAMRQLHRYLREAEFRIAAVEEPVPPEPSLGTPQGRLDVRLVDKNGKDAVLDLKWGEATYRTLLEEGRAVQLAVYSLALRARTSRISVPPAAYFALSTGQVLSSDPRMKAPKTIEGITLDKTWDRVARTRSAVHESFERGQIPIAHTHRTLPLLKQLGVEEKDSDQYYQVEEDAPCQYCDYKPLCGLAWEDFR